MGIGGLGWFDLFFVIGHWYHYSRHHICTWEKKEKVVPPHRVVIFPHENPQPCPPSPLVASEQWVFLSSLSSTQEAGDMESYYAPVVEAGKKKAIRNQC